MAFAFTAGSVGVDQAAGVVLLTGAWGGAPGTLGGFAVTRAFDLAGPS